MDIKSLKTIFTNFLSNQVINVRRFVVFVEEVDLKKLNITNKPHSADLKVFFSALIPTALVMYAFTLGYLQAFGVPVSLSVTDAVYFASKLIFGSLNTFSFSVFVRFLLGNFFNIYNAFIVGVLVVFYICLVTEDKNFWGAGKKIFSLVKKMFIAEVIIGIVVFQLVIFWSVLEWNFGGSFFYPDKSYLGLPPRTMLNLSKLFFGALSSGIFILPFFSDMISKNFKTLFTNTLIFRITLLVVCLIAAYKLSYSYSAEYISYPQARLSDRIEKPKILIWSTENTFFYLNCDGSLKLEGVRNDKIFFSRDVDGYRNRGPCRGLKN